MAGMAQVVVSNPSGVTSGFWEFPVTGAPSLTIKSTHSGNFTQGQTGATYIITVSNLGTGSTSDAVTVTDVLPTGLTATAITGAGWTCRQPSGPCTRNDAMAAGATYPSPHPNGERIADACCGLTHHVAVSGGL